MHPLKLACTLIFVLILLLGATTEQAEASSIWGTGSRRRATDRAKTFEELQAEAERRDDSSALFSDKPNNNANELHKESMKKNRSLPHRHGSKATQEEVETFLYSMFEHVRGLLGAPNLAVRLENFVTAVLSKYDKEADIEKFRALLQERNVADLLSEAQEHMLSLQQRIPSIATSINDALSPTDIRALLALDFSFLTSANGEIPPDHDSYDEFLSFVQSVVKENDHMLSSDGALEYFTELLSSVTGEQGVGFEAMMNKFMMSAQGDALSSISEEVLANPKHFLDNFRKQLQETPFLADMAGISSSVVKDDRKWNKFAKSLQANLDLLQEGIGSGGVEDIFGVNNPQFANIMQSISALENDIKHVKSGKKNGRRNKKHSSHQTFRSATAAK